MEYQDLKKNDIKGQKKIQKGNFPSLFIYE